MRIGSRLLSRLRPEQDRPWRADGPFSRRRYESYADYVAHQGSKLGTVDLSEYEARYRAALTERLRHVQAGERVLCLGARLGGEVRAFHDLGCFAVGIDLNPGPDNRYVLAGDFHDLQFPNATVDVVFTNSFDHAHEPERVLAEIARVLAPDGRFISDTVLGGDEGNDPRGVYESFTWDHTDAFVQFVTDKGFALLDSSDFDQPWAGRHLTFRPGG